MSFAVPADAYDRFMGRYSRPMAPMFADFARIAAGLTVLDVGAGSGALTAEVASRVGDAGVSVAEPADGFAAALRERHPGSDVRHAPAEDLPFADDEFDVTVAQLVVPFMADPVAGLREMARVTRRHGTVATCVWDTAGDTSPLATMWEAAKRLDPAVRGEGHLAGARAGSLTVLFARAGMGHVHEEPLTVRVVHPSFEDWWEPYTFGVGPSGAYIASLDDDHREALRETCRRLLPEPPFTVSGTAWAARGTA
ncbi:MAG: methyltransferase domain-containing protein [Thermoleophilia bacterium]|nr:methyltransferase domain-containing protein [Thermoleophilia bacterium]